MGASAVFGPFHRWQRHARAAALLGSVGLAASVANAQQWTVVNLHPSWAVNSEATAIANGRQAGHATNGTVALVWSGSAASAVTLNPPGAAARADAAAGGQQGGEISTPENNSHAAIWSGTAPSLVDLHPTDLPIQHTRVLTMSADSQGGLWFPSEGGGGMFGIGRPCIWSGTGESFVDLTAPGYTTGEVRGVSGNQQVGAAFDFFLAEACLWNGTAESFVSLNPPEAIFSAAQCTDGVHQYGAIGILEPVMGIFPVRWSGTAASWVNLGVPDPTTRWGGVNATDGGYQAGNTTDTDGATNSRAALWAGEPGTFVDLHQFVPAEFTESNALGISRHAASGTIYVVGYGGNDGGNHREALMWVSGPGVNLITSPAAPADCAATAGDPLAFSVRILNAGPDASGPVTLTVTLPPASVATFAGAVPTPTGISPTQLTFALPPIAGAGAFTDVSITLTAAGAGATATISSNATTPGEVDPTNNSASVSTRIQPTPAATAAARAIFSTNPALANSLIPGGGGRFTGFDRPRSSPSGNWWVMKALTDQPEAQRRVLVRTATGGASAIAVQTGITTTPNGTVSDVDPGAEVNDAGLIAITGSDAGPAASNRFVAVTDGSTFTDVAREGQAAPAAPGVTYGSSSASANILASGQVGFFFASGTAGSNAFYSANGGTVIAQQNQTIPDGASAPVVALTPNGSGTGGLALDATGTHSLYQATLGNGDTATDVVLVADDAVVMQEGVTVLDGLSSPVDGNNKFFMMGAGGAWLVRGSNTTATERWVARGSGSEIEQVYTVGDPIHAGAAEAWRIVGVEPTFFAHVPDATGNYVIGGTTDNADPFGNTVLVYNNQRVIARENDPVDLDGNGAFDDGVYIRSFDLDTVVFVPGGVLAVVSLRDEDAALCRTNNTSRGQAVIRIPLPCPADFDGDGAVTPSDVAAFINTWFTSVQQGTLAGDFDGNGEVDPSDVAAFINTWFTALTGGCA